MIAYTEKISNDQAGLIFEEQLHGNRGELEKTFNTSRDFPG